MKKSLITSLLLLFLLTFASLNYAYESVSALDVSSPDQTFGFQNGSYIGFRDPISFVTPVDGGQTQQIASSNVSYPDFMFFQKQGSNDVYGFWASGVNVTVNSFFASNILEIVCVGAGTVKVQVGPYGAPVSISGSSGVYDTTLKVVVITVTSSATVPGSGGGATPTPAPTSSVTPNPSGYPTSGPTPTLPPLGLNDFQVSNLDLGAIQPNSTVTATLHFRFSGSSYTLQALSLPEPFSSWYVPSGNFSSLVYMLNVNGESSGNVALTFEVGNVTSQSYSGEFSVTAKDAFGAVHTSSGTISAEIASGSGRFDIVGFFKLHPLYLVLVAVVVIVLLVLLVLFSKRRR
jgi:hypothetical protein